VLAATGLVRAYPARGTRGASELSERALDDVNITIRPGERVGLVGESGAGKSTLVRTLLALEAPDAGSVRLGGRAFLANATLAQRPLRRQVQAVFQDPYGSLNPRYRVGRIVAEPLALLDTAPTRAERAARVQRALADVGLDAAAASRFPHEFSGGERQRIALARALIIDPALLILDEVVSSLDASRRAEILALLVALSDARGLAYLLVSHDIAVVRAATDRVLVMQAGRIVEEGATAGVLDHPRDPYTRALIDATPDLTRQRLSAPSGA
jgi:peptide/nickel transport system ATP-binding protein